MNSKAKKQAICKLWRLEHYFFSLKLGEYADMSNEEFDWIQDHLRSTISSIANFEDTEGTYNNEVEELEA